MVATLVAAATATAAVVLDDGDAERTAIAPGVVVTISEGPVTEISRHQLDHWVEVTRRQQDGRKPTPETTLRERVLRLLIDAAWLENEASRRGIEVSEADVERTRRSQFPSGPRYRRFLLDSGMTDADVARRLRVHLLTVRLQEDVLREREPVDPTRVEDYYERNRESFQEPERRELRIVLSRSLGKAGQARTRLDGNHSAAAWSRAARSFSVDPVTRGTGGLLAPVRKGELDRVLDVLVFRASEGRVVGPVVTDGGLFAVFEVTRVVQPHRLSLADAAPEIRAILGERSRRTALERFRKDLRARWKPATACQEGFVVEQCGG